MADIESLLRDMTPSRVLDVATGAGNMARHLRSQYPGMGAIIGLDASIAGLDRSRKSLDTVEDYHALCGDAGTMPFSNDTFDLVCISNSLHHLEDIHGALTDMVRVIRPGAWFLCTEMYRDGQTEAQMTHVLMHQWWAKIDMLRDVTHHRTFTRSAITEILGRSSLEISGMEDNAYTDGDPLDPELTEKLRGAVDHYQEVLKTMEEPNPDLMQEGEELRERLNRVGFHPATSLTVLCRKIV